MNEFAAYTVERGGGVNGTADISPDVLRKLLRYEPETGRLFWRERTIDVYPGGKRVTPALVARWNRDHAGKEAFTARHNQGYRIGRLFDTAYLAHRVIFAIVEGRFAEFIDHENGDRSDNRWENLREATRLDNQRNMKIPITNTSGHMGIAMLNGKWRAQINAGEKNFHLGMYSTMKDALTARKAAEKILGFHKNHGRKS